MFWLTVGPLSLGGLFIGTAVGILQPPGEKVTGTLIAQKDNRWAIEYEVNGEKKMTKSFTSTDSGCFHACKHPLWTGLSNNNKETMWITNSDPATGTKDWSGPTVLLVFGVLCLLFGFAMLTAFVYKKYQARRRAYEVPSNTTS
jgi:hypothetical protein